MRNKDRKYGKKPLYRKENRTAHGVWCKSQPYRWRRHSKRTLRDQRMRGSMQSGKYGWDYTPLYRFLLSKVGEEWNAVHQEAVSRLNDTAPIFYMVALTEEEREDYVCLGESSYYSGLFVDNDGRLQKVDPDLTVELMRPFCGCCTHTFNGVPFILPFDWSLPKGPIDGRSGIM